jgi:hypothetical protein
MKEQKVKRRNESRATISISIFNFILIIAAAWQKRRNSGEKCI